MVRKGRLVLPLSLCRASTSSLVLTVRSPKGMPRAVRKLRPDPQGAQLQVANLLGQTMLQVPLEANTQDMELQIDHLPTGVYLVSLLRPSMPPLTQRLMKH